MLEDVNYSVAEHRWHCDTDDAEMSDTDVFVEGKEYSVGWIFSAAVGYAFSEDTVITINGISDVLDMEYTGIDEDDNTAFFVWTIPTEAVSVKIIDTITIANACVTSIIGKQTGECLGYELPEDVNYSVAEHYWYCDTDDVEMTDTDMFVEGKEYSVGWTFLAADGYEFSEDTVITINGSTEILDMEYTEIDEDDNTFFFVWTIPTEAVSVKIIDTITITDAFVTPNIGKQAGECLDYDLPEDANYTVSKHSWYCDTDDAEMSDTDVFEECKVYSLTWDFAAADGYEFSEDTVITINGSTDIVDMDNTLISDNPEMFFVWTLPTEAVEAEPEFELGDVNMDGVINTGDAVIILRQNVGIVTFTEQQEELADYNKDGNINTGDAVAVLRYCVSKAQAVKYVDPTIE